MARLRDLLTIESFLPPGLNNAITDVPGVAVGHYTLIKGEGAWQPGQGPFRTGVTVIVPHEGNLYEDKVSAAVHRINGFGKVFGFEQVRELGTIETPVALTGTLNVPRVADALITLAIEENPHIGIGFETSGRTGYASVNPVVGETSDGFLSDLQARPIGEAEVRAAVASASSSQVEEGSVGAGAGTSCFGWKGGIGTASRRLREEHGSFTLGTLVQTNFGTPRELTMLGVPVGRHLQPPGQPTPPVGGSIMIVVATDAPLDGRQLERLSKRAAFGLGRTGSTCHPSSGDFVIAFSTTLRVEDRPDGILHKPSVLSDEKSLIRQLGLAVVESVEEAICNSLLMAETVVGRDGHTRHALPEEEVVALLRRFGR
jgi:D-aminopeptidase